MMVALSRALSFRLRMTKSWIFSRSPYFSRVTCASQLSLHPCALSAEKLCLAVDGWCRAAIEGRGAADGLSNATGRCRRGTPVARLWRDSPPRLPVARTEIAEIAFASRGRWRLCRVRDGERRGGRADGS